MQTWQPPYPVTQWMYCSWATASFDTSMLPGYFVGATVKSTRWPTRPSMVPGSSSKHTNLQIPQQPLHCKLNSLENELNPDNIMNGIVDLIAVINRNCPNSHIALGVPLPRLCATADTTRRYDFCRDKVEQRIKGLANKRQCVTAVSADELATHTTEWFRDNKHLTHQPTPTSGGRTGLGVLVKAFKTALYPLTRTAQPRRQFSDSTDRPGYRHSGRPIFIRSLTRPDADAIPSSRYPTSGLDNAHSSRPRNTHNHMPVDPQPSRPEHPTNTPFIQYPSQFQAQRMDHLHIYTCVFIGASLLHE